MKTQKLLGTGNVKLEKGEKKGYLTFGLSLAPSDVSGYNTCPRASKACRAGCLNITGRGQMGMVQTARIKKTRRFFEDRGAFMAQLVAEIGTAVKHAGKKNMTPVFRLNVFSDVAWETIPVPGAANVFEAFPLVQFYDYTKVPGRVTPANYHLTFSRSESNARAVAAEFATERNVAVVFDKLPDTYMGRVVIDGMETDLRFLDPAGVVVGLEAKGKKMKADRSGMMVQLTRSAA